MVPQESPLAAIEERTPQSIRQLQLDDPSIGSLLRAKEEDKKLTSDQARGKGPEVQRLLQLWERLLIEEGMLKRKYEDSQGCTSWIQLVVPKSLRRLCKKCMREPQKDTWEKTKPSIR